MTVNESPNPDPLLRKALLGRYLAKRIVSATIDSVTYEAVDKTTGAAVRIVRPVRLPGAAPLDVSQLRAVSDTLASLRGVSGLVLPLAAGILDAYPFLVLPSLGQKKVFDRLGSQLGEVSQGLSAATPSWLIQISTALDAMHARGICHGRLSPEAVVSLEDGRVGLDGLPLALMSRAIDAGGSLPAVRSSGWMAYAAPELVAGGMPSPAADQYTLARMVADVLGGESGLTVETSEGSRGKQPVVPHALSRALSKNPRDRFSRCGEFVGCLISEHDKPLKSTTPRLGGPLEVEMAPVLGNDAGRGGRARSAPADTPLELDASFISPTNKSPVTRYRGDDEEQLLDITFTKPGENLLTERDKLSKAASLGASQASWRRMARELQQLSGSRQWVARAIAGLGGLLLASVLLAAGWRLAVGVSSWARAAWESAGSVVQPDLGSLKKSGEQVIGKAKDLFAEWRPQDSGANDPAAQDVQPPVKIGSLKAEGEPWPDRPEDQFSEEELAEPVALIDEINGAIDDPMSADGAGVLRGVFTVSDPTNPDEFAWVGGFGVSPKGREFTSSDKPLLDGTVVNRLDSTTTFVGHYALGVMKQFWLTVDDQGRRVTVSAKVDRVTDDVTLNGSAFVLDEGGPECLALVYDAGVLIGGQWCRPLKKDDSEASADALEPLAERVAFEAPMDIVKAEHLKALDPGFEKAIETLNAAVARVPDWNQRAREALKRRIAQGFRENKR